MRSFLSLINIILYDPQNEKFALKNEVYSFKKQRAPEAEGKPDGRWMYV